MAKDQTNRRRFEDKDRKPWTKEEREAYEKRRDLLCSYHPRFDYSCPEAKRRTSWRTFRNDALESISGKHLLAFSRFLRRGLSRCLCRSVHFQQG